MPARLRRGDMVAIVSGNDRGKRGRILRVMRKKDRVVVEGVNLVYKHLRKSQNHPQGGRIRREAAVHMSNVMPVDPETNRPTRVRFETSEGKAVRKGVKSGTSLDAAPKGAKKSAAKAKSGKAAEKSED